MYQQNYNISEMVSTFYDYILCYKPFLKLDKMTKTDKNKILKKTQKAEALINKGQSDLSAIANDIQHLFNQEVDVTWSTDGAVITDLDGEIDFLTNFINGL